MVNMMQSNPMLRQLSQTNPEIAYMFSNPEMLRQILTPEMMRMSMGMLQSMRGMPGGPFGAPRPSGTEGTGPAPQPNPNPFGMFDPAMMSQMMNMMNQMNMGGMMPPTGPAPTRPAPSTDKPAEAPKPEEKSQPGGPAPQPTAPQPNPNAFAPPPYFDMAAMLRMFRPPAPGTYGTSMGMPTGPSTSTGVPAPAVDPKVKYASQLEKMKEMGFTNEAVNLEALIATGGNVEAAVERLLTMLK